MKNPRVILLLAASLLGLGACNADLFTMKTRLNPTDPGFTAGADPCILILEGEDALWTGQGYDFGTVLVGSPLQITFLIQNKGGADLVLDADSPTGFSGTDAAQFSLYASPAQTIAAGAESTFVIQFTPAEAGAKNATLKVLSNDPNNGTYAISLQGAGSTTLPSVTTSAPSATSSTTAACGGAVTSDGGVTISARGVCWSTASNPKISDSCTVDGSGTGSFTSALTGLSASTSYYVRAYATNASGTAYGSEANFRTRGTVNYDGNGSTGGTVPTDGGSYAVGDTVTVLGNTGSLVKSGSTFAGWNTLSDGTGTSYAGGATFTMGSANVSLYAVWDPETTSIDFTNESTVTPLFQSWADSGTSASYTTDGLEIIAVKPSSGSIGYTLGSIASYSGDIDISLRFQKNGYGRMNFVLAACNSDGTYSSGYKLCGWCLDTNDTAYYSPWVLDGGTGCYSTIYDSANYIGNGWHTFRVVYSGTTVTFYRDGTQAAQFTGVSYTGSYNVIINVGDASWKGGNNDCIMGTLTCQQ